MLHLLGSAAIAYSIAFVAGFWLRDGGWKSRLAGMVAVSAAIFSPCVVPPDQTIMRGFAAFISGDMIFKIFDYSRPRRGTARDSQSIGEWLRFLVPFPVFLVVHEYRYCHLPETSPYWPKILETVGGAIGFAIGVILFYSANKLAILQSSFALDHGTKVILVVILCESASRFLHGLERLAGYDTTAPMHRAFVSSTVAEFWGRWNNRVQTWFRFNVFLPAGGTRAPIRAVVLCFLWSAIFHELMFGIATSRFDGYQFIFFMLQAPAVLASRRMDRLARRTGVVGPAMAHVLTISWISVTSIFFFSAVERVFPFFYVSQPVLP